MYNDSSDRKRRDEIVDLGIAILRNRIEPTLAPGDRGKFVAIDVDSGDFEIDEDDYTAIHRLKRRIPSARSFLGRAGYEATISFGMFQ